MKYRTDIHEYTSDDGKVNQYGIDDFSLSGIVDAKYIHSKTNPGNPFIEALPRPKTSEECGRVYKTPIVDFDIAEISQMSDNERIHQLTQLRQFRVPLSFDSVLERNMYDSLVQSYSNRYIMNAEQVGLAYLSQGSEKPPVKVFTDRYASTCGWSLLGNSGTGKSSSIDQLKSHYPQTIRHYGSFGEMVQIVYVEVCCPPNSNFSILYAEIGAEIDKALGITSGIYEDKVRKARDKFTEVKKLIETFAIGIIIFDEIQEIDFSGTKTNTFTTLTTLSQVTGAAMAVCGLESAYDKMFRKFYTGRRVGTPINSNSGCSDEEVFNRIVDMLFAYQWFDSYIRPSADLRHALYTYSCGVIDALITMYTLMHIEYLRFPKNKRPSVDVHLLETVIDKYYGKLRNLLASAKKYKDKHGDFDADFTLIQNEARKKASGMLKPSETESMKKVIKSQDTVNSARNLALMQGNIVKNIQNVLPSADKRVIVKKLHEILSDKKKKDLSEKEISELIIRDIVAHDNPSPKVRKRKANVAVLRQNLTDVYTQG